MTLREPREARIASQSHIKCEKAKQTTNAKNTSETTEDLTIIATLPPDEDGTAFVRPTSVHGRTAGTAQKNHRHSSKNRKNQRRNRGSKRTDYPRLLQQAEIMEEYFITQVRAVADEDPAMKKLQQADWSMLQCNDPIIHHVLDWVTTPPVG